MYTRFGIKAFLLFLMVSPFGQAFAWWEAGHMIVADVAYANVKPNAKKKLKALLRLMSSENTPRNDYSYNENNVNYTMMAVSHWPADLHAFPN